MKEAICPSENAFKPTAKFSAVSLMITLSEWAGADPIKGSLNAWDTVKTISAPVLAQ